jgi:ATP-dependent RNA helicase HelY
VLQVLEHWGYVKGWSLTEAGGRLARIYHEQDLLLAECAERGLFDGLRPPDLAALASVFTYEARGPLGPTVASVRLPRGQVEERWRKVQSLYSELSHDEEAWGLPSSRPPDAGFAVLAHNWARGQDLAHTLSVDEAGTTARGPVMAAGDFVRNVKQLIDLLRQLGEVLVDPASASAARKAADALFRGVVAASSVVGPVGVASPAPAPSAPAGAEGKRAGDGPWTSTELPTSSTA